MVPRSALASAALCLLNDIAVLIREFPGGDLDEVDEPADTEETAGEEIENTRADLARIEAVDARAADKDAQQQEGQPVQGLIRAGHYRGRDVVGNRLVGKDLLDGVGHTVDVLALQQRSAGNALDALAHHAVFADVDAVDRGAAILRDRRDLDVRAVLDMEPDGKIKVWFLFKDDALGRRARREYRP